jgi:hypothetical protein
MLPELGVGNGGGEVARGLSLGGLMACREEKEAQQESCPHH